MELPVPGWSRFLVRPCLGSGDGVGEGNKELSSIWTGNELPVLGRIPVEADD